MKHEYKNIHVSVGLAFKLSLCKTVPSRKTRYNEKKYVNEESESNSSVFRA